MQQRLAELRLASKIAVFVPSHALAEETEAEWRKAGAHVAVLRGYEAQHPVHKKPMCRDIDLVRLAILNRTPVRSTACEKKKARCPYIDTCL